MESGHYEAAVNHFQILPRVKFSGSCTASRHQRQALSCVSHVFKVFQQAPSRSAGVDEGLIMKVEVYLTGDPTLNAINFCTFWETVQGRHIYNGRLMGNHMWHID